MHILARNIYMPTHTHSNYKYISVEDLWIPENLSTNGYSTSPLYFYCFLYSISILLKTFLFLKTFFPGDDLRSKLVENEQKIVNIKEHLFVLLYLFTFFILYIYIYIYIYIHIIAHSNNLNIIYLIAWPDLIRYMSMLNLLQWKWGTYLDHGSYV